jgi:hypothetical protein|tara:strand:+ start:4934 stop:5347 length:414 start_codon:yes stop_codon:yes gene_type:complete
MWFYNGKEFNPAEFDSSDLAGFVYLITDLNNGKKYVGKKNLWSTRRLRPLKGQKRRRVKKLESDWRDYFGSNEEVKLLVENEGRERFKREILRLCKSKGEMTYFEMKEQIDREVLFRDDYYNEFIGGKIHSKHLKGM